MAPEDGLREVLLVYRDRIVPRSEAQFLRRQYLGFRRLSPLWIGCRTDDGLQDLGVSPLILGRPGALGPLDRALFKQLGRVPPQPDLAALKPRLIHAHFGRGGALALPLARALRLPLAVTFHGGDATKETHYRPRLVPTIFQRRLAALQREASLVICVSDFIRDRLLARGFPAEKLQVIRYGIEMPEPDAAPAPPGAPYLLFVGRFVEKKGIAHLLEAMRLLERRGLGLRLVLIGDGPSAAALREAARPLAAVEFLGWRPHRDVLHWMRAAVAVCVPSVTAAAGDAEGLPNVVIEAMSVGTPVIASRSAGIGEAIEHELTGLLVAPGDAAAIARAAERLATNAEERGRMGRMARDRAAQRFSAVAQSRFLEDALLSCAASRVA